LDPQVQKKWRTWADDTIAESRRTGGTALLVSKIERRLYILRKGEVTATIVIGLGKYGLSDKLYEGDEATPEGRYRIVRKFPTSTFYKAMLIDYPNAEDVRTFAEARRKGLVPGRVSTAGGAIELHGGGKDSLTKGCVGMENPDMDILYKAAEVGTPVTIVGALAESGTILADIKAFEK
jgi:murein L,D-transpeptidase YafK